MDFFEITSPKAMEEISGSRQAFLAYFSHQNCNVCKVLKPKVRDLIADHFPKIALYYINTLEHPEIAAAYSVFTVPAILVLFEGKEYIRESRYVNLERFYERIRKLYRLYYS